MRLISINPFNRHAAIQASYTTQPSLSSSSLSWIQHPWVDIPRSLARIREQNVQSFREYCTPDCSIYPHVLNNTQTSPYKLRFYFLCSTTLPLYYMSLDVGYHCSCHSYFGLPFQCYSNFPSSREENYIPPIYIYISWTRHVFKCSKQHATYRLWN